MYNCLLGLTYGKSQGGWPEAMREAIGSLFKTVNSYSISSLEGTHPWMPNIMQKAKLEQEQLHVGARLPASLKPHHKVRVGVLVHQISGARHNGTKGVGALAGMNASAHSVFTLYKCPRNFRKQITIHPLYLSCLVNKF